jgi:hypothetical protein
VEQKQSNIKSYLPTKNERLVFVQGKVPESLYNAVKAELEKHDLSWSEFLIAVSKRFVEDLRK